MLEILAGRKKRRVRKQQPGCKSVLGCSWVDLGAIWSRAELQNRPEIKRAGFWKALSEALGGDEAARGWSAAVGSLQPTLTGASPAAVDNELLTAASGTGGGAGGVEACGRRLRSRQQKRLLQHQRAG